MTLPAHPSDAQLAGWARASGLVVGDGTVVVVSTSDGAAPAVSTAAGPVLGPLLVDRDGGRLPDWLVLDADLAPLPAARRPHALVRSTGAPVRDVVLGIRALRGDPSAPHRWVRTSAAPLALPGAEGAVISVVDPVTGEAGLRQRLVEARHMVDVLLGASGELIVRQGLGTPITWASAGSRAVLGLEPADLVGRRALDLIHPDDRAGVALSREVVDAAVRDTGGVLPLAQVRVRHADGHWVDVESSCRVVPGSVTGAESLQTVVRDVTDRVAAERAGRRTAALFESLVEHAPVGMAVRPADGPIDRVNRALCELLDRPPEALLGTYLAELTHPEDRPDSRATMAALRSGEVDGVHSERRYLRPDGTVVRVQRTTVALRAEDGTPTHYVTQLHDVTRRHDAAAELTRQAATDSLTGLANRAGLLAEIDADLARAWDEGGEVALIFVDLDHFKQVNDVFGHAVGDEVLRRTGRLLADAVRPGDLVGRLGGDEFVVLCRSTTGTATPEATAQRVRHRLSTTMTIEGHEVRVAASIGTTTGRRASAAALLHRADDAMYAAKRRRGTGAAPGAPPRGAETLPEAVRRAVHRGQLRLHHQPVVALDGGAVVAREALVRWQHPTRGLLLPAEFLPAVERGPVGADLGAWVLREACRQATRWDDGAVVHVNVSPRQLADPGFGDLVETELAAAGLPAARLCLEVTETLAVDASPTLLATAARLTGAGVGLALDDFGTGQSSITALRRLPVSVLKVDRSFVADVTVDARAAALVAGLVQLGAGMGLTVVAEGVETAAQVTWLREHGCALAQGFLLGRPAPQDEHPPSPIDHQE